MYALFGYLFCGGVHFLCSFVVVFCFVFLVGFFGCVLGFVWLVGCVFGCFGCGLWLWVLLFLWVVLGWVFDAPSELDLDSLY